MSLSFIYRLRFVADVHIAAIKRAREKHRRRNPTPAVQGTRWEPKLRLDA